MTAVLDPLIHCVDVQYQLPDGTDLGTPQTILPRTLVEIHCVPVRRPPDSAQVFQRVIHVQIRQMLRELRVPGRVRFQRRRADVMSSTIDKHIVANRASNRSCPFNWAICEQRHLPILLSQLVDLLRILLKLRTVNNFREMVDEPPVIHLFIEIACVNLESL